MKQGLGGKVSEGTCGYGENGQIGEEQSPFEKEKKLKNQE